MIRLDKMPNWELAKIRGDDSQPLCRLMQKLTLKNLALVEWLMFRQDCILECCAEMELFKVLLPLHGKVVWQVMGIQCSGTDEQPMSMEILNHQSHCPAQGIYAVRQ